MLKQKGHPIIGQFTRDFAGAEAADDETVVLKFRPETRARCAAVRRRPADLLARLLCGARISTRRRSMSPLGSRRLQGRALRIRALHRVRARQGLVGRRPADRARAIQFRQSCALNITAIAMSPSRLHQQELSVPRGVHLAHLGDALRFSGDPRRTREARNASRRNAVRRARLVPQHAARQVQGSPRARSAELRVRFRMDQQEHHVRLIRPYASRCSRIRP